MLLGLALGGPIQSRGIPTFWPPLGINPQGLQLKNPKTYKNKQARKKTFPSIAIMVLTLPFLNLEIHEFYLKGILHTLGP